jgi:putative ABC transport system permease protein
VTGRHASTRPRPFLLFRRGFAAGRGTAALLAVVAALTCGFVVAVPQLAAGAGDRALGDLVRAAPPGARDLGLRLVPQSTQGVALPSTDPGAEAAAPFDVVSRAVAGAARATGARLDAGPDLAAQSEPMTVVPRTRPLRVSAAEALVRLDDAYDARVRWVEGAAPGAATTRRTLDTISGQAHTVLVVPVALRDRTARTWGVRVGDVLELRQGSQATRRTTPTAVVLAGTFEPTDADDPGWAAEPRLLGIAKIPAPEGGSIDQAALVAPLSSYAALADGLWRIPAGGPIDASPALTHTWRWTLHPDRLTRADVAPLRALLVRLGSDPAVWSGIARRPAVVTGLPDLLDRYQRDLAVTDVLVSFVTAGVTALAVLVLALTALFGAERRRDQVRLLRLRGASTARVLGLVTGWTAGACVPAALLAALATGLLVAGPVPGAARLEVLAVTLLPGLVVLVATWLTVRRLGEVPDATRSLARAARRLVLELLVVALAVFAVTTVRSRGAVIVAGHADALAAVAPVLVALAAGVLAVRLLPGPLGLLARAAERRRGLGAFLGLGRAARTGAEAAVPVVALVVGTALVALTATVGSSLGAQRDLAARLAVGADARVDAGRIDAPDIAALAARPGVRSAVPAYVETAGGIEVDGRESLVTVLALDPARYADLLRDTPLAFAPPATHAGGGLPVVLSGGPAAAALGLVVRGTTLPAHRIATVPALARVVSGRESVVALVPLDALVDALPTVQPNTVYLAADRDAQAALAADAADDRTRLGALVTGVTTVDGVVGQVADGALASFVGATYLAGSLVGGVLTLLALLLLLAATRPARSQLLIRLRTLGLAPGSGRRLAWSEVMPVVVVGVLAGAAAGAAAPLVVGPALDLAAVTGAATRLALEPHPLAVALAAAAVLILGASALLVDAAATRRGDLAQHLRGGDTA